MGVDRHPIFQVVDGVKLPLGFDPDRLRSSLKYKPSVGDIFIDTFPKCGTNWTKRIVQLLVGNQTAQESDYGLSTSFFEMVGKDVIAGLPQPRIITSHLEYGLLPQHPQAKYIYVVRNPKDCCVSYYHHTRKTKAYHFEDGSFDEYLQLFVDGRTSFGDYFHHLVSWYPHVGDTNVLFLTYEGMKKDVSAAILKMAKFLDVQDPELVNPDSGPFKKVVELSDVAAMKEYLTANYSRAMGEGDPDKWTAKKDYPLDRAPPPPDALVRKGIIGDWKNHFTREHSRLIEQALVEKFGHVGDHTQLWDPKDWMEEF